MDLTERQFPGVQVPWDMILTNGVTEVCLDGSKFIGFITGIPKDDELFIIQFSVRKHGNGLPLGVHYLKTATALGYKRLKCTCAMNNPIVSALKRFNFKVVGVSSDNRVMLTKDL